LAAQIKGGSGLPALLAIESLGGVGKTMLARQLAFDLYRQKVFRAVLWADETAYLGLE